MLVLVERPGIYTPAVLSDGSGSSVGFCDEHVKGTIAKRNRPKAVEVLMRGTKLPRVVLERDKLLRSS
jgi:hypothetical protein